MIPLVEVPGELPHANDVPPIFRLPDDLKLQIAKYFVIGDQDPARHRREIPNLVNFMSTCQELHGLFKPLVYETLYVGRAATTTTRSFNVFARPSAMPIHQGLRGPGGPPSLRDADDFHASIMGDAIQTGRVTTSPGKLDIQVTDAKLKWTKDNRDLVARSLQENYALGPLVKRLVILDGSQFNAMPGRGGYAMDMATADAILLRIKILGSGSSDSASEPLLEVPNLILYEKLAHRTWLLEMTDEIKTGRRAREDPSEHWTGKGGYFKEADLDGFIYRSCPKLGKVTLFFTGGSHTLDIALPVLPEPPSEPMP